MTIDQFIPWGSPEEIERRRRIVLAVAAYAYEFLNVSLLSDADFDAECLLVDLSQTTGNTLMDAWWRENFDPNTGMWVHDHPDKRGLDRIARRMLRNRE
jgi:hypothetical protein